MGKRKRKAKQKKYNELTEDQKFDKGMWTYKVLAQSSKKILCKKVNEDFVRIPFIKEMFVRLNFNDKLMGRSDLITQLL